jgi:amino acid adenylation domain-containing protein
VVQAAYQNLTALLEHEQAPLSLAQRCSGVAQPMPLFSTLLNYRHSQLNEKATTEEATTGTSWAGIRILAAEEQTNYPVTLTVDDLGTHFHLMAQTVPEIDPDRMVNYLLTAIRGLVAALRHNPQQPIQPISVIPLAEQQQLLVDFNATQTAFPAPTHVLTPTNVLIHSLFEAEAARHPDAIAVVYGEQSLSYAELNRRANHLAHHLMVLGVQPDERVAICVERGPEMVAGLLAILKAGGAYVPLDPAYPAERLAYMLKDSAPVVLLTQSKIQQAIHFDWLSDTMPIIVLDDQAESERPERESNPVRSDLTAQHLAYVVYTSGSTGVPKGVMSSHQALANRLLWFVHSIATPPLVVAQKTSISFVDSVTETLGTLLAGGKLVVFSNDEVKDPARFCAGLQYHHVNLLVVVPSLLKLLVSQAPISQNRQDHALSSIRTLICSGERLTPELARQVSENYPSLRLLNFYGSSEINGDAIWHEYDAALGVPEASVIGRPIANSRCYILDAHQQLVPLGVAGEIYIAGRGLARGYLNRPELTAERFFADPFSDAPNEKMYRTGDLGRWLSDGTIEYLGRNDFQVKIRGFRIEPGEIEAQLLRCHGVKEAAVVAREDRPNQQQLVAYLRAQDGVELIPAELRQRLSLHLADYMLPTAFVVLETFPLTPNGKLDRKALPIPDAQAIVSRDYAAPLGETETILAQIWQDLLGLARVGRHDHFFELGGHSLLAIQLVARIRQALERELPLQTIFAQPVLMRLAHTLDQTGATKQSTTPKTIPKADRSQPLPLSFAQQRLWFLGQLDPAASLAYHLSAALRLTGSLNHHALTTALDNLVARHESLRTRFVTDVGQENAEQVYQHIDPADGGFSLLYRDLRQLIPSPHTQHVSDIIDLEARTPFDFAHDPLMRGQLLQLSDDEHVLLLTLHHIITDGWSLGVLVRELGAFYRAALNGHAASLPHLPVQYADYAVWQRAQQQEAALSAQRDFWRSQLAGIPALLTLPTDRPRPTVQSYRGGQVPFQLDATLLASLKRLGQRHNTTLFMTVLSAWSLVLARLSGQDDIVIGTPVANRPHQELEGLIGFFANTLALRIRLAKEMSVADLLAQTRGQALSAYAHQDLPFEQVVEALQPERSLSYSPIFQVMLTLNNTPAQSLELPGLQLASMEQSSIGQARHGAYFDLTLSLTEMPLTETESGLVGVLSYAADLFDFATVERMSGYLKNILTAMAADETQAVATLPMLTTAEKQQVLVHFNATQTDFLPANRLVHQMVEMQAAQQPDAIAVLFFDQTIGDQTIGDQIADHQTGDHQTLSYGELNRRANRLAHYLIALGVRPDERVAICVERSPEMVVGLLAILKAGGAYVPLDPAYPAERLAYMLQDAAPVVLLTQASLVQTLPSAEQTITLLLDSKPDYLAEQPAHNPDIAVLTPHHLAYVIYTSGSTGLPKGVEMPLGVLSNLLQWHRNAPQPAGTGKTLQFAALGFDVAFQEIFTTLGEGGSLVLIPETLRREPQQLLRLIQQQQIERIFLPYIALQHLAETADHHPGDLSCLAHVITAGEQLRITPAIQRFIRRAGCRLHNHYGPTESHVITSYTLSKAIEQWPTLPPIGRPIANARVYILDEYRQPVPLGVTGEIYLAGHGVAGYGLADQGLARGYLNRPELTAERFLNDPFSGDPNGKMYRTGDLGRWLPDGNIDYLGRNDFQVKLRGFRIELGEIEAQLMLCQGVREAVVIAREDEPDHKRLVAYVCLQEQCLQENRSQTDVGLNPAALRQQLSEHLAEYMLPSAFVMLDAFPLTPNGKLDRKALPAPDATAMVLRSYAAPVGETETALAHIWQDLLKLEQVGRHDHFFELGGHSLLAVQLVARVRQALGRGLQLQQLFAQPVLMDLARSMTEAAHEPQAAMTAITVADRSQPLPLSFAQQRLWFLAQLDPAASLAYHLSAALRLNGRLSQHALTVALNHLIARHEGLRTRFVAAGENVCQYIDPADNGFSLQYRDLRSLSPTQHTQQVIELIDLDARTPFDLSLGPLIRGQLLQLTDDEYVLLLTLHHIITDGWSLGVLVRELGAFYRAALYNAVHSLPPLSIQYADYAVWQRDQRQATALTEQRDFWCGQLKDAPALLTLPLDRPRPAVQSYAGSQVTFRLDAKTLASLKALGKRYNCTLFMALLTGWSIVLARLSGQDDIVIGTPVANRPQPELEELIGFFVNTLALRVRFSEGLSVAELLAQVRENALAAYAHQDLPFEQVVEALQPERSLSYSPVFQAMLALNNTPAQELNLPELRLTPFEQATHTTHFDLTLSLVETDSGLAGALSYATDLFDNATAERMVGYFVNVLTAMAADETQSIAHLPILPKAERQQLLVEFNDTPTPRPLINNPENSTIHRLFEIQAAQRPDAIALAFEGQKISYGELNQRANRLAHYLIALGVRPDDRVAICLERSADMIIGLLAILKAGGAYVPLDPAYPAERLRFMLDDASPMVLLTQTAQLSKLPNIVSPEDISTEVAPADSVPVFLFDKPGSALEAQPDHNPHRSDLTSRHLAYVIYTSGSTGQPKGVMVEHHSVNRLVINNTYAGIGADDCVAHCANVAFDASTWEIWSALLNGGRLYIVNPSVLFDPQRLCDSLIAGKVTALWLTAGLFNEYIDGLKPVFGQLRYLLVGGDVLDPLKIQHVLSAESAPARLINGYGPTETTTFAATYGITAPVDMARSIPIGRPIANTRIYILDRHGEPVPAGVTGELYIGGSGVARGYLNNPALTAERFMPDPFCDEPDAKMYKTGDLGRWLADGTIEYLGRNDFQVKLRGFRIELSEIETRLVQCHGVREAVVIAREETDSTQQKRLVAYLLPQPGIKLSPAELRQQLARHLAEYMLPSAFVTLTAFPLTPNGKLDRQALPAPDSSAIAARSYAAPVGKTETQLAQIWQALLGLPQIGRYDHFFELGGHSLLAVQLLNRMREQGMEMPLTALFAHPTLCDLACAIGERLAMSSISSAPVSLPLSPFEANPVPLSPAGSLPPLFLVHEASGDPLVYLPLAALLPPELPVYALQALGIHTIAQPPESIEALAACHIQAIRRLQPQGPYRLAGWSIGGLIAYEIARQLINSGDAVTFLGMIDSYHHVSDTSPGADQPAQPAKANNLAQQIELIIDALRIQDQQSLEALRKFDSLEQALDHCIARQWLPADITRQDILLRTYTAERVTQLGQRYVPEMSAIPVHFYNADELSNGALNDKNDWHGWRDIAGDNSELHMIGGTHFSIMQPPLLNQIADSITEQVQAVPIFDPRVIIQSGTKNHAPLFCLPGAGASPSSLLELALSFPPHLPIYALQARGFTEEHHFPYTSVEGAARAYIRTIRDIQPHGPYHLLGHSFGGWIAFEIALQLQAAGEQVANLIIIDSDAPDQPDSDRPSVNRTETIMELIDIYDMILNQPLPLTRQDIETRTPDEQTQLLHNTLVQAGLFAAKTPTSLLQGIIRVMQANLNTRYIPRTGYAGKVHLISAEEGSADEKETRESQWSTHVTQLDVMLVPGNHMTMLSMPSTGSWVNTLWQLYIDTNVD